MKDRRAQAWLARGAAPLVSLALAWTAMEPAGMQIARAGFDWEQQGPAARGSHGAMSDSTVQSAPVVAPSATMTSPSGPERIMPAAPAVQNWPPASPPRTDRFELRIQRLPGADTETLGHPEDKITRPRVWQGEVSELPLAGPADAESAIEPETMHITPAMAAVLREANVHTRLGMELGSRRAYYSARDEFIQSLNMIAQALDAEQQTMRHSVALAAGLRALEESDDFARHTTALAAEVNVHEIAALHRTPVVRGSQQAITPLSALQLYYTYAQQQLAESVDHHAAGSAALSSLGKLYAVAASDPTSKLLAPEPKAMALHQAALVVDEQNAVAANELGVLLARYGRYDDAVAWLQHSVAIAPQPATWHNLAVVHQTLGQTQLAEAARRRQLAMSPAGGPRVNGRVPDIRWVTTSEFATAGSGVGAESAPPTAAAPGSQRSATAPASPERARETMGSRPLLEPPRGSAHIQ